MKKFLFTVGLLFVALCIAAQTNDDYSWYLNKAKEQLGKGECDKAERNYNHYKALAHDSLPSLERQIQECLRVQAQASQKVDTEIVFVPVQAPAAESKPKSKENTYKVGQSIVINNITYVVAFVKEDGKHGFAISNQGRGRLTQKMIDERKVPSLEELIQMAQNKDELCLYERCWSYSRSSSDRYYSYDFASKEKVVRDKSDKNTILLIYRF